MNCTYLILFITLLVGCTANPGNDKSMVAPIEIADRATVPQKVKDYLAAKFPQWQIPDSTDYIKSWWSFYEKGTIPYYVTTDINNDRKPDHAILLKGKLALELVLLIDSANTFKQWKLHKPVETFQNEVKDIQYGLAIEPPGRTDCIIDGLEQSLVLKSNAFVLMFYEFKDKIFYLNETDIQEFKVR